MLDVVSYAGVWCVWCVKLRCGVLCWGVMSCAGCSELMDGAMVVWIVL